MAKTVQSQITKAMVRFAKGAETSITAFGVKATGTDFDDRFWQLIDDAADETYENAVESSAITAMDNVLFAGGITKCADIASWILAHHSYFTSSLGLTGGSPFEAYLWSKKIRAPYYFNEILKGVLGSSYALPSYLVFPKGTKVATTVAVPATSNLHKFGVQTSTTYSASGGDGALVGCLGAIVAVASATGGSGTLTVKTQAGANLTLPATTYSTSANGQVVIGAVALAASGSTGTLIKLGASGAGIFTGTASVPEYALLYKAGTNEYEDGVREIVKIVGVSTTDITVESTPIATSLDATYSLYPMFTDIVSIASGGGSVTNTFYALPDLTLAINFV